LVGVVAAALAALAGMSTARAEPAEPLTVRTRDERTLVLARPRAAGEVEGLVVDSEQLIDALKRRVLDARGLADVADLRSVGPLPSGEPEQRSEGPYTFTHRFGAPFDSLQADLRLGPLAEPDDDSLLVPLALLLGASVVLGLFALYRTTATQIEFAERRNDFVSAVSHELKTPLTAIRMYAEMLEDDVVSDEPRRREYYRTINAESERLSRLINNVLELARIERKPTALSLSTGELAPVVREALDVLRPHVEREGFGLELEVQDELPCVQFEPDAVRQILFNLIENALKYSSEASERRISVRLSSGRSGRVSLEVRDRGPGVQEAHLREIFEPFFREGRELTRKTRGTGIGLALVRGLVQRMGGEVRCTNANPGLRVSIELGMAAPAAS
jgi:signal transduction histidine kinase